MINGAMSTWDRITSIVKVYAGGEQITFDRWRQKTTRGILAPYSKAYRDSNGAEYGMWEYFFRPYRHADSIVVLALSGEAVEYTPAEFFEAIA